MSLSCSYRGAGPGRHRDIRSIPPCVIFVLIDRVVSIVVVITIVLS